MEKGKQMTENHLDNKWLDDVRQSMANYEANVPSDGWNVLSSSLDAYAQEIKPNITGTSQGQIIRMWAGRAAAIIGIISACSVMCYMPENMKETSLACGINIAEKEVASPIEMIMETSSHRSEARLVRNEKKDTKEIVRIISCYEYEDESIELDQIKDEKTVAEPETASSTTTLAPVAKSKNNTYASLNPYQRKMKSSVANNDWGLGIRFGGRGTSSGSKESYLDSGPIIGNIESSNSHKNDSLDNYLNEHNPTKLPTESSDYELYDDEVISSSAHTSWNLGVMIHRNITDRLSVESGLLYTILTSNVRLVNTGTTDQTLHYIGIPLRANYQIAELGKFSTYGSTGATIERCIKAMRGETKFSHKKWQTSLSASVGGQYSVTKLLGIYVEPGVTYYFKDGSDVPSLRTERPFSFTVNAGLRINLK